MILSLRHGPAPPGRRVFDVSAGETVQLAQGHYLQVIRCVEAPSAQQANRLAGVTWSHLAFSKA